VNCLWNGYLARSVSPLRLDARVLNREERPSELMSVSSWIIPAISREDDEDGRNVAVETLLLVTISAGTHPVLDTSLHCPVCSIATKEHAPTAGRATCRGFRGVYAMAREETGLGKRPRGRIQAGGRGEETTVAGSQGEKLS
jgi:hypothetical protein